jgi:hypothetical protein
MESVIRYYPWSIFLCLGIVNGARHDRVIAALFEAGGIFWNCSFSSRRLCSAFNALRFSLAMSIGCFEEWVDSVVEDSDFSSELAEDDKVFGLEFVIGSNFGIR